MSRLKWNEKDGDHTQFHNIVIQSIEQEASQVAFDILNAIT